MTADLPSLSDPELVARIVGGDEVALGTAYDRHADVIYGSVLRFIGDRQAAEEIVQDAYLVLWRQADRFVPSAGSLIGWLLRIARNKAIDRLRSAARRPSLVQLVGHPDEGTEAALDRAVGAGPAEGADLDSGPEAAATQRWARSVVRTALSAMPEPERRTLELAYDEDLTQVQIAERLGWPLGTVKSRTRRALATLREVLEGVPELVEGRDAGARLPPAWQPAQEHARGGPDASR